MTRFRPDPRARRLLLRNPGTLVSADGQRAEIRHLTNKLDYGFVGDTPVAILREPDGNVRDWIFRL